MIEVADQSVELIITSPPYWQLKDYGTAEQIGFGDSYDHYIYQLNQVWLECFRVLHDGCRLCINVADTFTTVNSFGRHKVMPIHAEIIHFCENVGLDFMGQIIWQKHANRHPSGGAMIMGSYPYPRNGVAKFDYEYILLFKKPGDAPKPIPECKEPAKMTGTEWNTYFTGQWSFNGTMQGKHPAMFPEELPRRLIKMFSFPQETVLDPFAGSGTTAKVAKELGRNSISYEINTEYVSMIHERLNQSFLFDF
jgi:site-specific DNA-methyltransferase (adenine-specific)